MLLSFHWYWCCAHCNTAEMLQTVNVSRLLTEWYQISTSCVLKCFCSQPLLTDWLTSIIATWCACLISLCMCRHLICDLGNDCRWSWRGRQNVWTTRQTDRQVSCTVSKWWGCQVCQQWLSTARSDFHYRSSARRRGRTHGGVNWQEECCVTSFTCYSQMCCNDIWQFLLFELRLDWYRARVRYPLS